MYAHNGRGFDNYIVLKTPGLKFKNIIRTNSNILKLDVLTPTCKIHFMCTLSHLTGSLDGLCKNFDIPTNLSKLSEKGFTWDEITESSWASYLHLVVPYLELDVMSL